VRRCEFRRRAGLIVFRVAGNSFLHQQVRRMAGALTQVGLGKLTLGAFEALASSRERSVAGPALPPQGLYLEAVEYAEFPPRLSERRDGSD
jgi:tRNA pseudouridine38-40 synthase